MKTGRLEAFSDGVLAIIITIMVLELKVPSGDTLAALGPLAPVGSAYVLSFLYVGIYWNNHHHLLHAAERVSGWVLWANLHLLFWLSLLPVATAWVGANHRAAAPTACYGGVLLMSALAYWGLQRALLAVNGREDSTLARALRNDWEGKVSPLLYVMAIALAAWGGWWWAADALYVAVALLWVVPDRRIEREVGVGE